MYNPELLDRLGKLWEAHPHQRFGQLIDNIFTVAGSYPNGIFYMEDSSVIKAIEKFEEHIDTYKNF